MYNYSKHFYKHTFDSNFKVASACIGPNKSGVLFYYFCNKQTIFLLKTFIFDVHEYISEVLNLQVLFICIYKQWHDYGQISTFCMVA